MNADFLSRPKSTEPDTAQKQLAAAAFRAFETYGADLNQLFREANQRSAESAQTERRIVDRVSVARG